MASLLRETDPNDLKRLGRMKTICGEKYTFPMFYSFSVKHVSETEP